MRIMGVDPGMTRCGIGVIDAVGGRRVSIVAVDVARTKPEMAPHQRLLIISNAIEEAIALYRPDVVAVERVFAQENVRSVTGTAQVAGLSCSVRPRPACRLACTPHPKSKRP